MNAKTPGDADGRTTPLGEVGEDPDPRFSLANERTFLAWNRTALALVAAGLAAAELLPDLDGPGSRRLLGLPLVAVGSVIAFTSYGRWQAAERAMRLGQPLPRSPLPRLLALAMAISAVVAGVLVAVGGRS
ncbi:MAG: DUF202 domain-containing protein [Actinomycetota bacterium]|nr:DUF202 domain-containing protein [Actinomycetota bacterium]